MSVILMEKKKFMKNKNFLTLALKSGLSRLKPICLYPSINARPRVVGVNKLFSFNAYSLVCIVSIC